MKRAMLAMLVMIFPLTAAAQDATGPAATSPATDTTVSAPTSEAAAQSTMYRGTKRRGSMVGYIEDPTVASQIRIRFDAGYDMSSPDRAEFFYGKCGCYRSLVGSPAYDPDAPGPGPGLLTGLNFQQLNFLGEYAFGRVSVFAELPVRWIKPIDFLPGTGSFDNQSGIADINAGLKFALAKADTHDVTFLLRGAFANGDAGKGLGTNHGTIEPAVLFRADTSARSAIEGEAGFIHPLSSSKGPLPGNGDFAGDIFYWGIGPSVDVYHSQKTSFSPVIELVGWHVINGYQTSTFLLNGGDASGTNIANLKLGARITSGGNSFYVGYGFALTDSVWYDKILRFEYRATLGR